MGPVVPLRTLTPKTNLANLRKEAKRWLKALRAGDARAVTRLRAAWPNVLDQARPDQPGLRDIQHALALEYGYGSWKLLKTAVEDMAVDRISHAERVDQLLRHAWDGDVVVARRILQRYPGIARDSLFTAAACGDVAEVERRLAREPNAAVKTGGPCNWTALAYVAYSRLDDTHAVTIARHLLDAGADPNFQFDDGWGSPFKILTGAVRLGEGARPSHPQVLDLVALLLAAGADPYDLQALYNVSIVGEDTFWYDWFWQACETGDRLDMWRVIGNGRLGAWKQLSTLDYLLGNAVGQDQIGRAQWLLARGADPNASHAYSGQPMHAMAQLRGSTDMMALLEQYGADPAVLTGVSAYQAAVLRLDRAAATAMIATDATLRHNPLPTLQAAEFGHAAAVDLLLSLGTPPGLTDQQGISPLHRAVQSGSLETVTCLIAAGADVDLRERRWHGTPLSWAGVLGRPQVASRLAPLSRDVRALVHQGLLHRLEDVLRAEPHLANHSLPEHDAPTPLFCLPDDEEAAVEVTRALLAHGARPDIRNNAGRTAADAARLRGLDEAADLMEENSRAA